MALRAIWHCEQLRSRSFPVSQNITKTKQAHTPKTMARKWLSSPLSNVLVLCRDTRNVWTPRTRRHEFVLKSRWHMLQSAQRTRTQHPALGCLLQGIEHRCLRDRHTPTYPRQESPRPAVFGSPKLTLPWRPLAHAHIPDAERAPLGTMWIRTRRCSARASLQTFPHAHSHAHVHSDSPSTTRTSRFRVPVPPYPSGVMSWR